MAGCWGDGVRRLGARSGDHTVKLVCCRSGARVRVLTGHRRTPWVVRFHPRSSALLASGSLDYEARLLSVFQSSVTGYVQRGRLHPAHWLRGVLAR